jgi:FkbM family methyltransferase
MKPLTKTVHDIVRRCNLDSFIARVGSDNRLLNKLIPLPAEYKVGTSKTIKRDGVHFQVDLSDYMQWCLFSNQPDRSWKLALTELRKGAIVLDIGANVGHFCLKVGKGMIQKKIDASIYAFEPNPHTFSLLEQNLKLNPELQPSIQVKQLAIGDEAALMNFSYDPDNTGGGRLSEWPTGLQVEVVRLDDWFRQAELARVDFIKIDVEGYEPKVLLGASKIISSFRPILYLEITDEWFKKIGFSAAWVFQKLDELGYELFIDKLDEIEKLERSAVLAKQFNIMAVPKK